MQIIHLTPIEREHILWAFDPLGTPQKAGQIIRQCRLLAAKLEEVM